MAANPDYHEDNGSIDWEAHDRAILEMYAANPGLEEELNQMERDIESGKIQLIENEEVRRRLRKLGLPV